MGGSKNKQLVNMIWNHVRGYEHKELVRRYLLEYLKDKDLLDLSNKDYITFKYFLKNHINLMENYPTLEVLRRNVSDFRYYFNSLEETKLKQYIKIYFVWFPIRLKKKLNSYAWYNKETIFDSFFESDETKNYLDYKYYSIESIIRGVTVLVYTDLCSRGFLSYTIDKNFVEPIELRYFNYNKGIIELCEDKVYSVKLGFYHGYWTERIPIKVDRDAAMREWYFSGTITDEKILRYASFSFDVIEITNKKSNRTKVAELALEEDIDVPYFIKEGFVEQLSEDALKLILNEIKRKEEYKDKHNIREKQNILKEGKKN